MDSSDLATVHYVRQGEPLGLGHAVLCAEQHVGNDPFAVPLGDDLIDPRDALLSRMIEVRQAFGGSVIALTEVPADRAHLYGCAAVEPVECGDDPDVVRVTGLVEKPAPGSAPSNYAIIGRYILHPGVFGVLRRTAPGRGGEIQLTDALATMAAHSDEMAGPVHAVVFRGRRYDTGDRGDYLKAVVRLACEREDLGPDFREWLRSYVDTEMP